MDREKVFDALRNCITEPKCKDCPWEECEQFDCKYTEIPVHLGLDILELLKEQQPETTKPQIHNSSADVWYYVCDDCDYPISPGDHYCGNCGKKIVWDTFVQS